MGTGSFPGVKRPGRGADHQPPSKCRGQERVGLYLYTPSGPSWPVMGAPLPFLTLFGEFYKVPFHFAWRWAANQPSSLLGLVIMSLIKKMPFPFLLKTVYDYIFYD